MSVGTQTLVVDLLAENPCPTISLSDESIPFSMMGLREKFLEILVAEGFTESDIATMKLLFDFTRYSQPWSCDCHSRMVLKSGKEFRYSVNHIGHTVLPNEENADLQAFWNDGK